jgi:hypothetical protein
MTFVNSNSIRKVFSLKFGINTLAKVFAVHS